MAAGPARGCGGNAGGTSFGGFGVGFRDVDHGANDPTASAAEDRYDFSCFLGGGSVEAISFSSLGRSGRPRFLLIPVHADVDSITEAGR